MRLSHRLARLRAIAAGPDAYRAYLERRAAHKRANRARKRTAGITSKGTRLKYPAIQRANLRRVGTHPVGCPCYDCLWGRQTVRLPVVRRYVSRSGGRYG